MYGLVNQGIKDLVVSKFGHETWIKIAKQAGVTGEDFEFMINYPDKTTYDLVASASQTLNIPAADLLSVYGDHWVSYTGKEGYGPLMDFFGSSFFEFLGNLNSMHARMGMTMPELAPPYFDFKPMNARSGVLEYRSTRKGLAPMVIGILNGLAKKFNIQIQIEQLSDGDSTGSSLFKVTQVENKIE